MRHLRTALKGSRGNGVPTDRVRRGGGRRARRLLLDFSTSRLEDRCLLASGDLATVPVSLVLNVSTARSLLPSTSTADVYRFDAPEAGRLTVELAAPGKSARLTLLDAQGTPLVQSDATAVDGSTRLDVDVPSGTGFVKVENAGARDSYSLNAYAIPAIAPFSTIPANFQGAGLPPMSVADFNGDGVADLATPDGIRLGLGNGTFSSSFYATDFTSTDESISAVSAGDFNGDGRIDLAILVAVGDTGATNLEILRNLGGGVFSTVSTFAVDDESGTLQTIDYGDGIVGLAVANVYTGTVAVFDSDGAGGFVPGAVLTGATHPTSIVTGRFDGRRLLIIADQGDSVSGEGGGLKVYRSNGAGLFLRLSDLDAQLGPAALAKGDFNGDGRLDLAVANLNSNSVSILLGGVAGTFGSAVSFAVGILPKSMTVGDFDGDGRLDLAVANANAGDVSVLLGNGDGTFQMQIRSTVSDFPSAIAATDLNGDGRLDLVVANKGSNDVSLLLGKGDGTFQDGVLNHVGSGPNGAVTVDLDRDGHLDLVTVNPYSNDVSVLLGKGDGTFQKAMSFAAGARPYAVTVGDFNGDGRSDLAVSNLGDPNTGEGMGISILYGNGDGTFRSPVRYLDGVPPTGIITGDFNGDGRLDLATLDALSGAVRILAGTPSGIFTPLPPINLISDPDNPSSFLFLVPGDFNGDGVDDIAVFTSTFSWDDFSNIGSVVVITKSTTNGFQLLPASNAGVGFPTAMVAADFNGDGNLDLAIASPEQAGAVVMAGDGHGGFAPIGTVSLGDVGYPVAIVAGDFTGDGKPDLAITDGSSNNVFVFPNQGNGNFGDAVVLSSEEPQGALATGDFNGDGRLDLAITRQPSSVQIELSQGNGGFVDPSLVGVTPRDTPLVADLDGDGVLDIAVVDGSGNILFRKGQRGQPGSFDPPITVNPGIPSRDITALTIDHVLVLASANANNGFVSLFGYRGGQFILLRSIPVGSTPAQVIAADILGSGTTRDLVVRNAGDGTISVVLGDGNGEFTRYITLQVGAGISNLTLADVNGDNLPDILLSNQTSGRVEVMLNQGEGNFSAPRLYRAGGGLARVNDEDGKLISREGTVGVVAVSLTRGGVVDLVALNPGSATLGILFGLGGGAFSNPGVSLTRGEQWVARSADLNGDGIGDVVTLGVEGLTIWRGDGAGRLRQWAVYQVGDDPNGLSIADINGDGKLDLIVGDSTGDVRLLLGDGLGSFRPPFTADQGVSLVAVDVAGKTTKTFIFADQSRDRVVVRDAGSSAQPTILGDRGTGLLVPGTPILADLNNDGILDLIVANSGGNSVLVYPGLADGTFGPALNSGQGFSVGTNPSSVIAADVNGDSLPDLIVANKGSNDVSVLINASQAASKNFAFSKGELRLQAGQGPTSLAYADINGDGYGDLVVSSGASHDLRVFMGLASGFFDDTQPRVLPLDQAPGTIVIGNFTSDPGKEIVTLNPWANSLTMISGLAGGLPTTRVFSSGGTNPVAALAVSTSGGYDSLVVANNGDGRFALFSGGGSGLSLQNTLFAPEAPNPTSLALGSIQGNSLEVFAATEGAESATLLIFSLGGVTTSGVVSQDAALTLLPSQGSSIPLIATLLTTVLTTTLGPNDSATTDDSAALASTSGSVGSAAGQSLLVEAEDNEQGDDDTLKPKPEDPDEAAESSLPGWLRFVLGLDEAFAGFHLEHPLTNASDTEGKEDRESSSLPRDGSEIPTSRANPDGESNDVHTRTDPKEIVDAAVFALIEEIELMNGLATDGSISVVSATDGEESNLSTASLSRHRSWNPTSDDRFARTLVLGGLLIQTVRAAHVSRLPGGARFGRRKAKWGIGSDAGESVAKASAGGISGDLASTN